MARRKEWVEISEQTVRGIAGKDMCAQITEAMDIGTGVLVRETSAMLRDGRWDLVSTSLVHIDAAYLRGTDIKYE